MKIREKNKINLVVGRWHSGRAPLSMYIIPISNLLEVTGSIP